MDRNVPDESRSWWMPDADPETAARQLHDGLERLREHVAAYRERRLRTATSAEETTSSAEQPSA